MGSLAIEMYRGDSYPLNFTLRSRETGLPITLSGQLSLSVASKQDPAPEDILFTLTGVINVVPATGKFSFTPTVQQTNIAKGRYFYDIQLVNAQGHVRTLVKDIFEITNDITK